MTKSSLSWMLLTAVVLALGCGGGGGAPGGGTTGGGGTGATPAPGIYIEFISPSGAWMDPLNLRVGDTGSAVIASYDSLGGRSALPGSDWQSTAPGNVTIGALGNFQVFSSPGAVFTIQGTASTPAPTVYSQAAAVPVSTTVVNGRLVELGLFTGLPTSKGIPHVRVDFFNNVGIIVGSARTMQNGTFSALVPTTTQELMVDGSSVSTTIYHRSVYYATKTYSPADTGCRITVGPVGAGPVNLPASMGLPLASGGPPPPPNACY